MLGDKYYHYCLHMKALCNGPVQRLQLYACFRGSLIQQEYSLSCGQMSVH